MTPTLPGLETLHERWARFHRKNPEVYALFKRFAAEARAAGLSRFSADAIVHRLRWYTTVETRGSRFKLNNNWAAFYARQLIHEDATYADFFETRASPRPRPGGD